jgi:hypothetical protein
MSGEIEDKQMAIYSYGPGRSINELKKMLIIDGEHFSGTAVTDGYTVYDNYTDFSGHAGCWAHYSSRIIILDKLTSAFI